MTSINDTKSLPIHYGDTKIVLLPKDPISMFTYWEISQETKNNLSQSYGDNFNPSSMILRVYDTTNILFNGNNANTSFDIHIGETSDGWYINVGQYNRSWCVEVGYILKNGVFIVIARSNIVRLPKYGVSDNEEFNDNLTLFNLPFGIPSSKRVNPNTEIPREKFFWLKADTEIVIYGATDPDASLTIAGKPATLNKDGSFSAVFHLPVGSSEFEIEAVTSDKSMSKRTVFSINKQTK
jgi:hypothetical protein